MRREDCVDLFGKIPQVYHPQINLILRGQGMITVDVVIRFESHYVVLRGREQGSTDEGRAFFVPYEEIAYFRLERVVKLGEIKSMYGESGFVDAEDALLAAADKPDADPAAETSAGDASKTPPPMATPLGPTDPGAIARQNLLERIRAARANVGGATGRVGGR
ncbi:hypothetical protein [Urbifossiella limnaea]|uniref:Uncharacterized protein n=1 Tax=Urbifossiella limnaea TaxID=2528023 RepID=A0A517XX27_9BACT|nr:hypothetical protein [Urbifossiella limnaea]QDU22059.1 hypothetical protein ETAA1_40340 [Urbifossiella limnaea]